MYNLILLSAKPLPLEQPGCCQWMAFDGGSFLFGGPRAKDVAHFAADGTPLDDICCENRYACLCYDAAEDCFWGIPSHTLALHQLDRELCVTGRFYPLGEEKGQICSISCTDSEIVLYTQNAIHLLAKPPKAAASWNNPPGIYACCGCILEGNIHIVCRSYVAASFSPIAICEEDLAPVNMACLPAGLYARSACAAYDPQNQPHLFVLASRSHQQHFLLNYLLYDAREELCL